MLHHSWEPSQLRKPLQRAQQGRIEGLHRADGHALLCGVFIPARPEYTVWGQGWVAPTKQAHSCSLQQPHALANARASSRGMLSKPEWTSAAKLVQRSQYDGPKGHSFHSFRQLGQQIPNLQTSVDCFQRRLLASAGQNSLWSWRVRRAVCIAQQQGWALLLLACGAHPEAAQPRRRAHFSSGPPRL